MERKLLDILVTGLLVFGLVLMVASSFLTMEFGSVSGEPILFTGAIMMLAGVMTMAKLLELDDEKEET